MAIPENLLKEWDSARNGSSLNYSRSCKQKVSWICKNGANEVSGVGGVGNSCGCHVWEASISSRIIAGSGCPYCSGRKVCIHASLQTLRPDLLEEWDHVKNKILPSEVSLGSKKKVWWKCKNGANVANVANVVSEVCRDGANVANEVSGVCRDGGGVCGCHVWEASITKRTAHGGCPYCSGRRTCLHASLQTLRPDLLEEWDYVKNKILPSEVSPGSREKVSWICKNNTRHVWDAVVYSRTRGRGCPHCAKDKRCSFLSSSRKKKKDALPVLNMTWVCSNIGCGQTWISTMDEVLDGRVCPHCAELGVWTNPGSSVYLE